MFSNHKEDNIKDYENHISLNFIYKLPEQTANPENEFEHNLLI